MKKQTKELATHYQVCDLYYAAYLKTAGVPFVGTKRDSENPKKVYFVFENVEGLSSLKTGYYNRNAKVVALNFCDELKALKSLTFI